MPLGNETMKNATKALRWLAGALLAVLVIYLAGANLLLNTGLLGSIFPKRERLLVEVESGWTAVPGRIHIEGFRMRGQTKKFQWQARLEAADLQISLLALASRTVRISRVRGSTLDFRLRRRLTAETANSPEAALYPEIEGFSNPPDPAPEDIYPPKKKKRPFGWHVDISDLLLDGPMDVWMGTLRMTGDGTVAAGFDFVIRGLLEMPSTRFDLADGTISQGSELLVEGLDISTDLSLGPYRPKEVRGTGVFKHLLGNVQLEGGVVPDLRAFNRFLPAAGAMTFEGGTASFAMTLDKPSNEEGSSGRVEIAADDADLRLSGRQVKGDLDLESHLVRGSLAETRWQVGETTLALDDVRLAEDLSAAGGEGGEEDAFEGWWGRFRMVSGVLDLGEPSDLDVVAEVELSNSKPLLAVIFGKEQTDAEGLAFPGWLRLIPDITNLKGSATIDVDRDGSRIDDIVLTGDRFELMGRLAARDDRVDGVVYVRHGILDLGLGLSGGKKKLKLIRPRKWFLEQAELDDSGRLSPADTEIQAHLEEGAGAEASGGSPDSPPSSAVNP